MNILSNFVFFLTLLPILNALTPQQIAENAFPSSVILVMLDENGVANKTGSGFFISRNIVVTNYHVIKDCKGGVVKIINDSELSKIDSVIAIDEAFDLAILSVFRPSVKSLQLGDSRRVKVGQSVYVVGNPQGLEGTFSNGVVSSLRRFGGDYLIQMTAPISKGSSGGPVFNNDGEVIGVSVGIVQSGQNLNFAIPSEYLVYLIESIDKGENLSIELPSKVPSPFTPRYKNSSKIVQKTKFGYNANIVSIHDLDFIDYSRSKIDEKKPILSTDDIFIMTR